MSHSEGICDWLKLARAEGVGSVTFGALLKRFGSLDAVFGASVHELTKVNGIGAKKAEKIARTRHSFNALEELELADKLGVCVVNFEDSRYPGALRQLCDPPPVLYFKGSLAKSDNLAIGIVGARRCSSYGSEQASRLGHFLAASGFTIVSGMARGIDTAAHLGALSANGRTIAVQGCGLANVFPPENNKLFGEICGSGACISELPLRAEPLAENFPPRNRIIAGLCLGSIVVEAMQRSGAMITARACAEYNREVMAVPGKIDSPLSRGPHSLIKDGARLIESIEDVTEALGYIGANLKGHIESASAAAEQKVEASLFDTASLQLSDNERKVAGVLSAEPVHIEHIIAQTGLGAGAINASLISLRLKGLIKQRPGDFFCRR